MHVPSGYKKQACLIVVVLCVVVGAILIRHNVRINITPADRHAIEKALKRAGYPPSDVERRDSFHANIRNIRAVQDAVLTTTPEQGKIPRGKPREPAELLRRQAAQCGDRSRFMHKAFRMLGYNVRFASLYSTNKVPTAFHALLTPGGGKVKSHAVVEVKTQKGWMIVDSVHRWIARDQEGEAYSLAQWQDYAPKDAKSWSHLNKGTIYPVLADDFIYMYGLYSRHGHFYPPYNPVPDIHWPAFITNIYRW
jgi:hypothetical protein